LRCHFRLSVVGAADTKDTKAAQLRGFLASGRRDLNSGPLVPQTPQAVWQAMAGSGGKWLGLAVGGRNR
jgi:hypothetical protein